MTILKNTTDTHLTKVLHFTRLVALVSSIIIVIGSIGLHSVSSAPLDISDLKSQVADNDNNWVIQTITDRRLISTLVAAQASIFCPLFVLVANITVEITDSMIEIACQFLMPLGLAVCWVFSVLFDLKSTNILADAQFCLDSNNCSLLLLLHGLKYIIIALFAFEPILVGVICYKNYQSRRIQLPLTEEEKN